MFACHATPLDLPTLPFSARNQRPSPTHQNNSVTTGPGRKSARTGQRNKFARSTTLSTKKRLLLVLPCQPERIHASNKRIVKWERRPISLNIPFRIPCYGKTKIGMPIIPLRNLEPGRGSPASPNTEYRDRSREANMMEKYTSHPPNPLRGSKQHDQKNPLPPFVTNQFFLAASHSGILVRASSMNDTWG